MGVRVRNFKVVYESVTMTPIDPQYLIAEKKDIERYIDEYGEMPDDPEYSKEDLILDLTDSSGFYCLPDGIKDETADYVADLVDWILRK